MGSWVRKRPVVRLCRSVVPLKVDDGANGAPAQRPRAAEERAVHSRLGACRLAGTPAGRPVWIPGPWTEQSETIGRHGRRQMRPGSSPPVGGGGFLEVVQREPPWQELSDPAIPSQAEVNSSPT